MRVRGILVAFHHPRHISPPGRRFGGQPGDCTIAEQVSDRLLRLPLFYTLTESERADVVGAIRDFA